MAFGRGAGGSEVIDRGDRPIVADGQPQLSRRRALARVSLCDVEPGIVPRCSEHERRRLRSLPRARSIAASYVVVPAVSAARRTCAVVSAIPAIASSTSVSRYPPCSSGGPATDLVDCATTGVVHRRADVLCRHICTIQLSTTLPKCCSSRGVLSDSSSPTRTAFQ
jgi:hypothetical protein